MYQVRSFPPIEIVFREKASLIYEIEEEVSTLVKQRLNTYKKKQEKNNVGN